MSRPTAVRARRWLPALAAVCAALLALTAPAAAHAAPSPQGREHATGWYLALGDSLAAGFQPSPTRHDDPTGGYVGHVLDAVRAESPKTRLTNLACSGATSTTMRLGGGACTYEEGSQYAQALEFLHAHRETTRLVTVTVGANDVTSCLQQADPATCVGGRLATYGANLGAMLAGLHAAAPDAHVVVTNYYNPYLALYFDPTRNGLVPLTIQLQLLLNATIAQVTASATGGTGEVADVATEFRSYDQTPVPGTTVPTNVARICAWTWMCSLGDIHANDLGYAAIGRAVVARL